MYFQMKDCYSKTKTLGDIDITDWLNLADTFHLSYNNAIQQKPLRFPKKCAIMENDQIFFTLSAR